ncbi:MFS transporter [Nocardioides sp. zg-536]|uniref:MFS transporter n=1 Tax=Nocardioides faecalis TaxID=2803858 RepID=A0A938Y9Z0_9ACTN|nr:MFS transporter [Nocardioides faecalis]MBM9460560.1 MFS transporter [Nocardioides faecalis]MBS4754377.1 MFS transporter [Nocardioides faecalis]QVI57510.1 MFS transporter [Nocardioides faecalis]
MLDAYRRIFTPATALFSLTGLVARLPISMVGLGIVLLAEHTTGSYGFAGAVSAVAVLFNALFAIPQGRLLDRLGQSRVLPAVISLWGVALSLGMLSLHEGWPTWTTFVLAAVAGASLPSVGTCVRARWSYTLAERPERLHTAFSFEAVADEAVFLVGPIAVTLLATAVHPLAGLGFALVTGVVGTFAFAAQRRTEPPANPPREVGSVRPPMPWGAILPLTVVSAALGVLFGAAEVVTVAFADEQGQKSAAGFLLAIWALGSLLAGIVSGAVAWRRGPLVRLRIGALGMLVAMLPLSLVPSVPVMAFVLLIGGLAISPTLIATMSLAEQVLPPTRLTEGMAFIQTGLAAGIAPGAAVAGLIIDHAGASPAYLVSAAGGILVLLGALAVRLPTTVTPHERPATAHLA